MCSSDLENSSSQVFRSDGVKRRLLLNHPTKSGEIFTAGRSDAYLQLCRRKFFVLTHGFIYKNRIYFSRYRRIRSRHVSSSTPPSRHPRGIHVIAASASSQHCITLTSSRSTLGEGSFLKLQKLLKTCKIHISLTVTRKIMIFIPKFVPDQPLSPFLSSCEGLYSLMY